MKPKPEYCRGCRENEEFKEYQCAWQTPIRMEMINEDCPCGYCLIKMVCEKPCSKLKKFDEKFEEITDE